MFENNSKFPRFFIYVLLVLAVTTFVGMFFSIKFVGSAYFITLLVCIVFAIIDKANKSTISNYKLTFFLYELINLIAVIAIIYYEHTTYFSALNVFLSLLIGIEVVHMVVDVFVVKNQNISKREGLLIDLVKIGSMICITTYFYKVSILWFAICAFAFEVGTLTLKLVCNFFFRKQEVVEETMESKIESRIHSIYDFEGDGE